ncbi:hypothetical protein Godav_003986 [Gossypium davidsonii]|uniref:Uncharacterized protein n=1 Tax=Gossypium davidsonii TaxID=34287 RepID=A0A7J8SJJ2_GOSDV|nr:hypothetical protein [Gossypium davidsonii]
MLLMSQRVNQNSKVHHLL